MNYLYYKIYLEQYVPNNEALYYNYRIFFEVQNKQVKYLLLHIKVALSKLIELKSHKL